MDLTNLLKMGATAFIQSKMSGDSGSNLDTDTLTSTLSGLLGGSSSGDNFNIGDLLGKMQSGGLADIAQSWLGNGDNAEISDDNVTEMFGADKISEFASKLGLSQEEAVGGLRDAIPSMVDNASSGGSLLGSIGGVSGAINMAGKFFGR